MLEQLTTGMSADLPSFSGGNSITEIKASPSITPINQQDVQQFQQALENNPSRATGVIENKSHPLSHLSSLEADAMSKLQNLSTSLNPGDYMKTARSLSAYQLESLVAVKVIAKSTQAIEKLTNLQ